MMNYFIQFSKAILQYLNQSLLTLHLNVLKWPKTVCTFVLLIFISCVLFSKKISPAIRVEDFGGSFLQSYLDYEFLKSDFEIEDQLTLIFKKDFPLTAQEYCKIDKWIRSEYQTNIKILKVSSAFDFRYIESPNSYTLFYPKIFQDPCNQKFQIKELERSPFLSLFQNENKSDFIVHLQFYPNAEEQLSLNYYDYQNIEQTIERAKNVWNDTVYVGGSLFYQSSVLKGISYANFVNILTAILLLTGYFFFYRSKLATFILLFIIFFTNALLKFLMGQFDHKMDPLSSCLFLMITLAIIEDYIFLSFFLFQKKMTYLEANKQLLLPSFLTSLTTSIGFGSLALSPNPNIVQFAIWTSLGALFEWFLIFIILPCFYLLNIGTSNYWIRSIHCRSPDFKKIMKVVPNKGITFFLISIFFIFPFIKEKANINYSPFDLFQKNHPISNFREYISSSRNIEGEISLVFAQPTNISDSFISELRKIPHIQNIYSIQNINSITHNYDPEIQKLILFDFKSSQMGKTFVGKKSERLIIQTDSIEASAIESVQDQLNQTCQTLLSNSCYAVGDIIVSKDYSFSIIRTLFDSFTFCFILIGFIMLILVFAIDYKKTIPILLSVFWAPVTLLTLVIFIQMKVSVITCVALATLVGLAGDNAIQFLLLNKKNLEDSIQDFGIASIQNFILIGLVSMPLFISFFQTSKMLAALILLSVFLMIVGDIWILKGLLKYFKSKVSK